MDGFMLGIIRLVARIKDLRDDGHPIQDKWMLSANKKRYKIYFMNQFFDKSTLH